MENVILKDIYGKHVVISFVDLVDFMDDELMEYLNDLNIENNQKYIETYIYMAHDRDVNFNEWLKESYKIDVIEYWFD